MAKVSKPIDLSISQELYDSCRTTLDKIVELAEEKPLAVVKLSLKLQLALRQIERNAALKANDNGISWTRIGQAIGFGHTWAWERYKMGPTRQFGKRAITTPLTGEMREDLSETSPAEVKE